jgi:hypothetical protein
MPTLSFRKKAAEPEPEPVVAKDGGKGRPTPTRKAANAARPVTPYLDGGAKKKRGSVDKSERRKATDERRRQMREGELPRDAGPERRLARDLVDSQRTLLGLLLPATIAAFFLIQSRIPALILFGLAVEIGFGTVALIQGIRISSRIEREVYARYPNCTIKVRSYVVRRAMAPRRWRVPTPRVKPGDTV